MYYVKTYANFHNVVGGHITCQKKSFVMDGHFKKCNASYFVGVSFFEMFIFVLSMIPIPKIT
jgi:hypothetical protein